MAEDHPKTPKLITFEEAGELLDLSHYTARRLAQEGEIPLIRLRTATRTTLEGVLAYIERSTQPSAAQA